MNPPQTKSCVWNLIRNFEPGSCGVTDYVLRLVENMGPIEEDLCLWVWGDISTKNQRDIGLHIPKHLHMREGTILAFLMELFRDRRTHRVVVQYTTSNYRKDPWLPILALLARIGTRIEIRFLFHEVLQNAPPGSKWWKKVAYKLLAVKELGLTRLARRIYVTTEYKRKELDDRTGCGSKTHRTRIPSTIPVLSVPEAENVRFREKELARMGVQEPATLLLLFTRVFAGNRNHYQLLHAFAEARKMDPTLHLWVIGAVTDDPATFSQAKEVLDDEAHGVHFLGSLSCEEVSRRFWVADAMVSSPPTWRIETSGSVSTALAHGLPVIFCDGEDIPRDLQPLVGVIESFDGEAFLQAVETLRDRRVPRAKITAYYQKYYSPSNSAREVFGP